ncbi:MAG: Hsp33 family molecular chaperone HslO [Clostridiales bacterium]|nr:Hsp33 family molecular chaperone HslO [Candidatus Apopatocola equi]
MGEIIRAVSDEDFVKISVITARDVAERARRIHGLQPVGTAALGRTLCGAAMLGEVMKEERAQLSIRVNGGGPLGTVLAISDSEGNVRGYVENPEVDLPIRESDGKLDVGAAVGRNGLLTVSRDLGLREPYTGSTELHSGEIGEDLVAYLTESEQLGAACGLGVLVDTDCSVKAAGGFIVQLMPFAPEETVAQLEDNIFMMDQLTTILDEDDIEEVIRQVLKDIPWHIVERHSVEYRCDCSREKVTRALLSLSDDDLNELTADGAPIEVSCRFCDAIYSITAEEILKMAEE